MTCSAGSSPTCSTKPARPRRPSLRNNARCRVQMSEWRSTSARLLTRTATRTVCIRCFSVPPHADCL
jgi:hypothetical protein